MDPRDNAQVHQLILAERKRIGRDLHDSTMQSLYAIGLRLEHHTENADLPAEVRQALEEILQDLRITMVRMRLYVDRLANEDALGVEQHLKQLVGELQSQLMTPISFTVEDGTELGFGAQTVQEIGMIVREAVTNAVRHGKAQSIDVTLKGTDHGVQLSITDNGQGFVITDENAGIHHGVRNMRERAELLGGKLQVHSTVGKGTIVSLEIPLR